MDGFPLPRDIIFKCICPHLSPNDIRTGMFVCVSWFKTLIADGAFAYYKAVLLYTAPELSVLFEAHPWEYGDERTAESIRPSAAKKLKRAWIMPRGGTWFILKRYIHKAREFRGVQALFVMKNPLARDVLIASAKRIISPIEEEDRWYESYRIDKGDRASWFRILFFVKVGADGIHHSISVRFEKSIKIVYTYRLVVPSGLASYAMEWKCPWVRDTLLPLNDCMWHLDGVIDPAQHWQRSEWTRHYARRPPLLLTTLNLDVK